MNDGVGHRLHLAAFAVDPMSRSKVESAAERILTDLRPGVLVRPTRLDVVTMLDDLESHYGLTLAVENTGDGSEGYIDPLNNLIVIDTPVYEAACQGNGRARMTCAHEIAHVVHLPQAHAMIREGAVRMARSFNKLVPAYLDPEWQARAIGGALILPRRTVPCVYSDGGIDAVIETFGVSREAARVRIQILTEAGLISKQRGF